MNMKKITAALLAIFFIFSCFLTTAFAANPIATVMGDKNILSYKYSERDDYWYTDKDNAWQHRFGYSAIYDLVAPYIGMEYDYVRVHFEYEDKDRMVQLWKGQYGPFFYGCETGVYIKPHSDTPDTTTTFYQCADNDNRLQIQTNLYHYDLTEKETRVFSTPDEQTWWSTGFKAGHLLKEEPANELKQTGTIIFDSPEMARKFADGLIECGFQEVSGSISEDTFKVDSSKVEYSWRNISQAENTMPVKVAGATAIIVGFSAVAAMFAGIIGLGIISLFIL